MAMKQLRVDMTFLEEARKKYLELKEKLERADLSDLDRASLTLAFYKLGSSLSAAIREWRDLDAK
jgi:hypothetical protein